VLRISICWREGFWLKAAVLEESRAEGEGELRVREKKSQGSTSAVAK
jgi:hypothetical protein